jgi:hypothetical protein
MSAEARKCEILRIANKSRPHALLEINKSGNRPTAAARKIGKKWEKIGNAKWVLELARLKL